MNYKKLLEALLGNLDEGILVTDAHARITFYKEPATNIAGAEASKIIGKNILEVFPELTQETSSFYKVLRNQKPVIDRIQHYINHEGKPVSIVSSTVPLFESGELVGAFEIFKDLTQMIQLSEEIVSLQERLHKGKVDKQTFNGNGTRFNLDSFMGQSEAILNLKSKVAKIAESDSPVLVYGETGTGKELLVQSIHNASVNRRKNSFIAQNCAALPPNLLESILFGTDAGSYTGAKDKPGLFELADGGTLFLDEINALDIELQAKLLRVLQDGQVRRVGGTRTKAVHVRIIAATNELPENLIERGALRRDLYYRLKVIYLAIPPLRERKQDIELLLTHFIKKYSDKLGLKMAEVPFDCDVKAFLMAYDWQGNVREMEHLVESTLNFAHEGCLTLSQVLEHFPSRPTIEGADSLLSPNVPAVAPMLNEALAVLEVNMVEQAIMQNCGNYAAAARQLGIPKQTLQNKLKKHCICWEELMRRSVK